MQKSISIFGRRFGVGALIQLAMGILVLGMVISMGLVFTSQASASINDSNASANINKITVSLGVFGDWYSLIVLAGIMAFVLGLLLVIYVQFRQAGAVLE